MRRAALAILVLAGCGGSVSQKAADEGTTVGSAATLSVYCPHDGCRTYRAVGPCTGVLKPSACPSPTNWRRCPATWQGIQYNHAWHVEYEHAYHCRVKNHWIGGRTLSRKL